MTVAAASFSANIAPLGNKGLQNRANQRLVVIMKRETTENRRTEEVRKNVAAHRARQAAAGRVALNTYVPGELIEAIDQIKEQRGASSRMPIIEEALRFYIENAQRA
jgi:hypothetical protein